MKLGDFEVERLADDLQKAYRDIDSLSSEVKRLRGLIKEDIAMEKKDKITNAVEILHRRYVGDNDERKASLQEERVNAEVAQTIYDLLMFFRSGIWNALKGP